MFSLLWPSPTSHNPLSKHTVGLQAQSLHCPKAHILLLHLLESHGGRGSVQAMERALRPRSR